MKFKLWSIFLAFICIIEENRSVESPRRLKIDLGKSIPAEKNETTRKNDTTPVLRQLGLGTREYPSKPSTATLDVAGGPIVKPCANGNSKEHSRTTSKPANDVKQPLNLPTGAPFLKKNPTATKNHGLPAEKNETTRKNDTTPVLRQLGLGTSLLSRPPYFKADQKDNHNGVKKVPYVKQQRGYIKKEKKEDVTEVSEKKVTSQKQKEEFKKRIDALFPKKASDLKPQIEKKCDCYKIVPSPDLDRNPKDPPNQYSDSLDERYPNEDLTILTSGLGKQDLPGYRDTKHVELPHSYKRIPKITHLKRDKLPASGVRLPEYKYKEAIQLAGFLDYVDEPTAYKPEDNSPSQVFFEEYPQPYDEQDNYYEDKAYSHQQYPDKDFRSYQRLNIEELYYSIR